MLSRRSANTPYQQPRRAHRAHDYWMSYSDMMAAILLVFILFLTLTVFDYRTVLSTKQNQIDRLLGVREDIIQALRTEFGSEDVNVEVDPQTGAIRFQGGVFFGFDSTEISLAGQSYLQQFVPKYMSIILSPRFRPYIAQIIVEGHTDRNGTYLYNLDLSQRRAYAVVHYILSSEFPDFPEKQYLKKVITANGRSYSRPLTRNGVIDWNHSRRVEFKFRLKDDELIRQIEHLLTR